MRHATRGCGIIGAAPNFNRVLAKAAGRYWKWMAHDDVLAPDFLAASLAMLEAQPDAVLCYSAAEIIDRHGRLLFTDDSSREPSGPGRRTGSPRRSSISTCASRSSA